jgi:hypothetical protein
MEHLPFVHHTSKSRTKHVKYEQYFYLTAQLNLNHHTFDQPPTALTTISNTDQKEQTTNGFYVVHPFS